MDIKILNCILFIFVIVSLVAYFSIPETFTNNQKINYLENFKSDTDPEDPEEPELPEPSEDQEEIVRVQLSGIPYDIICNIILRELTKEEWNIGKKNKFIQEISTLLDVKKNDIEILSPRIEDITETQMPEDIIESFSQNLPLEVQFQVKNVDISIVEDKKEKISKLTKLSGFGDVVILQLLSQKSRDTNTENEMRGALERQERANEAQVQQNEDDKEKKIRAYNPKIQKELLINDSESLLGMFSKLSDAEKLCGEISDRQEQIDIKEENKILKKAKIQIDEQQARIVELNEILTRLRKDKMKNDLISKKCQSNNQKLINNDYNIVKKLASNNLLKNQSTNINLNVSDSLKALAQSMNKDSSCDNNSINSSEYDNNCESCGFNCDDNSQPVPILGKSCCECADPTTESGCPQGYAGTFPNCLPEEFKMCLDHPIGSMERAECIIDNGGARFARPYNTSGPSFPESALRGRSGLPSKYGAIESELDDSDTQDIDWYKVCGVDESKYIDLDELKNGICHGCDYDTLKKYKTKITADFQ